MAKGYIQSYSGFIGADMSSDPRAVARNRLAYSVNMWRDYESDQGEAIETFPGFRIAVNALSANVHGLYHYRTRSGVDYVIAHFGTKLYAFEKKKLAAGECTADNGDLEGVTLADADSTGFVYNNNLYILDGSNYWVVTTQGIDSNETVVAKDALADPYIPTTYYNGKPYEQRNMLTNTVWQYDGLFKKIDSSINIPLDYFNFEREASTTTIYSTRCYTGIKSGCYISHPIIGDYEENFKLQKFSEAFFVDVKEITIVAAETVTFEEDSLTQFPNVEKINIYFSAAECSIVIKSNEGNEQLTEINVFMRKSAGVSIQDYTETYFELYIPHKDFENFSEFSIPTWNQSVYIDCCEPVDTIISVQNTETKKAVDFLCEKVDAEINGKNVKCIQRIFLLSKDIVTVDANGDKKYTAVKSKFNLLPLRFSKGGFADDNLDYLDNKETSGVSAISNCTKAAVYDGRVFLTGNPDLPNTTFYTHRNLTGANDPAYFGVYNYFNDGVGNTPNVELLALPSMLMVLKNDTLSDGSIYYHVGQFNTDEDTMGLLPRIYPATTGAAGLGSVGENAPSERRGNTTCNFLDDPVFLSRRGLEAVGKEQVNLERAVTHRSSNVDRLLIKENLSEASIAEWKGYLVICVNGNMYLADSRHMSQHPDGSVQYEWYYLEGLKTYKEYKKAYKYLESPGVFTDDEWEALNEYKLWPYGEDDDRGEVFSEEDEGMEQTDGVINGTLYYRVVDGVSYILERAGDEMIGSGVEYPAKKIIAAGQHLIFGTDRGDLCIINTDKRGESVGDRKVKADVIDYTWYTFAGVRYVSGCSTKLDDCDQKIYTKTTIPGTTTVRFKTMLNSSCKINSRVDGENWSEVGSAVNYLGRATGSELDFGDINFANFAFAGNDNNVVVVPEISRCWINKQYYVYSDGYSAPFGLYELSYAYKSGGRIRY